MFAQPPTVFFVHFPIVGSTNWLSLQARKWLGQPKRKRLKPLQIKSAYIYIYMIIISKKKGGGLTSYYAQISFAIKEDLILPDIP